MTFRPLTSILPVQKISRNWANSADSPKVITATFTPFTSPGQPLGPLAQILATRFNSSEDYHLFPDVLPFISYLRSIRSQMFIIGVLTNSDNRVPSILSSLGLKVHSKRYGDTPVPFDLSGQTPVERPCGIDFVTISYDTGYEKPRREIFDAARYLGCGDDSDGWTCIHVGDDLNEDVLGAQRAGWEAVLLDRSIEGESSQQPGTSGYVRVNDLMQLKELLSLSFG